MVKGYADELRNWKRLDSQDQSQPGAADPAAVQQNKDASYRHATMRRFTSALRKQALATGFFGWSGEISRLEPGQDGLTLAVTVCPEALKQAGGIAALKQDGGIAALKQDGGIAAEASGYSLFSLVPPNSPLQKSLSGLKPGDRVAFNAGIDMTQHKETGDRLSEIQQTLLGVRFLRMTKQ